MWNSNKGLTLIEVLVALAIAALLAVTGYRSLSGLLTAQQQLQEHGEYWRELDQAMAWINRDLQLHFRLHAFEGNATSAQWQQLGTQQTASAVRYHLLDGTLKRNAEVIAEGIAAAKLSYFVDGQWRDTYLGNDLKGVQLELTTTRGEQLSRLFYVP
jgi:prepilin-type N-terminal cleavage/methylation domain-containing protein